MIPMKRHYDAGELYGEKMRGKMACMRANRWYNSIARLPVTTDSEKVNCKKCLRNMGRLGACTHESGQQESTGESGFPRTRE